MVSTDQNNSTSVLGSLGLGAPPTTSTSKKTYLGVPKGYQPPSASGGTGVIPPGSEFPTPFDAGPVGQVNPITGGHVQSPQYTEADKYGPAADLNSIPQIQAELVAAGLLSVKDVRKGIWDSKSADAYGEVLAFANQQGLNASDALTLLTANPSIGGVKGAKAAPTISFTNPQDVQTGFQNVSQSLTGQEQNPSQFVGQYHGLEAAQAHGTGQDYTQAPSITGAATQYVQNNMPSQELAYGVATRMNDFLSMLGQK